MDSNPIHHPSPAKKMKCSFFDYVQLLMINQKKLVNGLKTHLPSSQKNEMLIFGLHSTSDDRPSWLMDSNPIHHPSPAKKMKSSFLDCVHFWWSTGLLNGLKPHLPALSSQKMKSSFLDYIQLLMIGRASWGTQTPFATPLHPKKWNATFWITFNFWWLAGLVNGLKPHPPPLSSQRNEMLIFGLRSLLMICLADWWTWTSSATPLLPKKWNAHFLITFNFWWSAKLVNWLKVHLPALSSQ